MQRALRLDVVQSVRVRHHLNEAARTGCGYHAVRWISTQMKIVMQSKETEGAY